MASAAAATARRASGEMTSSAAAAPDATVGGGDARTRRSCRLRSDISRIVLPCSLCATQNASASRGSPTASYATSARAAESASLSPWWNLCARRLLARNASSDSPSLRPSSASASPPSPRRKGESRLSAAAAATAPARHPRASDAAAARSMRACLGLMGSAAMARPTGVSAPTSSSSPAAPIAPRPSPPRVGRNAPRIISVRCARANAAGSGGEMNGKRATRSMPMARI